jgi:hypothetical protein
MFLDNIAAAQLERTFDTYHGTREGSLPPSERPDFTRLHPITVQKAINK